MNFEDSEAELLQRCNKIDTYYLSFKHAFLKGFKESFYKNSLDDQIAIIMGLISVDDVDLISKLGKLTKNNAESFFRYLFYNEKFLKRFENHFASKLDEEAFQATLKAVRPKVIQQLIDDGVDFDTVVRITQLTPKEIQTLKVNSQNKSQDPDGTSLAN